MTLRYRFKRKQGTSVWVWNANFKNKNFSTTSNIFYMIGLVEKPRKSRNYWNAFLCGFSMVKKSRNQRHFDELSEDERIQDAEQRFRVEVYFSVIDILCNWFKERFKSFKEVVSLFHILSPKMLSKASEHEWLNFQHAWWKSIMKTWVKIFLGKWLVSELFFEDNLKIWKIFEKLGQL